MIPQNTLSTHFIQELPDAAVLCNKEGFITFANHKALQLFDTDEREVLAQPLTKFIEIASDNSDLYFVLSEFANKTVHHHLIYVSEQYDLHLLRDLSGTARNEVALRKALHQAEETIRLKSAFLASMSHEIRTPLTSILGFASVLHEELSGHHREFVELISESGKRLLETINSVLDLARLESEGMITRSKVFSVNDEITRSVELLRPLAKAKNLHLKVHHLAQDVYAKLDDACFRRVLNNVVGNALKYTLEGGVDVSIEADEHWFYVKVEDTGVGISEDFLPHLFKEFKQERLGLYQGRDSSGLGLSITRHLLDLMGGAIMVESTKGKGSCFQIVFPQHFIEKPAPVLQFAPKTFEPSQFAHKSLLIIDNDEQICNLIAHMLSPYCQTTFVSDEREIYNIIGRESFDCIFLDVNLGMRSTGIDILNHIRTYSVYAHTPIVALTAYALPNDRKLFLDDGFDDYISKPFTKIDLLTVLDKVLSHR